MRGRRRPTAGGRRLLARSPALAALFWARALSVVGDGIGNLALVVLVQRSEGTGTAVALLLLVVALPRLLSPLTGTLADLGDRRAVLMAGEVGQAVVVGVVALWLPPLPVLLALLLAKSTLVAVAEPAGRAAVPALVDDADLPAANALLGGLREAGEVLGPLAGGLVVAAGGVRAGLALDALTFVASVPLLARLPRLRAEAGAEVRWAEAAREGVRFTVRDPVARVVALAFLLAGLGAADDVALPFLATTLGAGEVGIGVLYAAVGAGLVGTYVIVGRGTRHRVAAAAFVAGAAAAGAANVLTGLAPTIVAAVAFQVGRGAGLAVFDATLQTLLQRSVPPHLLGRVFANVYGAVNVAAAAALLAGGPLLDATSARTVLVLSGVAGLAGAAIGAAGLRAPRRGSAGAEQ